MILETLFFYWQGDSDSLGCRRHPYPAVRWANLVVL